MIYEEDILLETMWSEEETSSSALATHIEGYKGHIFLTPCNPLKIDIISKCSKI